MKKIKTITGEVEVYCCDACGTDIGTYYNAFRCFVCGRDVCNSCSSLISFYDQSILSGFYAHYRHFVCESCVEMGKDIIPDITKNRNRAAQEDAILFKQWRDIVGAEI